MSSTVLSESGVNVYDAITRKIAEAIEVGAGQFVMPWHRGRSEALFPVNAATEAPYRGVNVIALWAEANCKGYAAAQWASYKQWQTLGAQVRKGERGSIIIFFKKIETNETATSAEATDQVELPHLVGRAYHVFNVAQVDGWKAPLPTWKTDVEINESVEAFVQATKADIRHGFDMALYRRDADRIEMPNPDRFFGTPTSTATEAYYSTTLHELTHWTGARHRLDRDFGKRFGDRAYAFEELTAELGAAFLCSALGIANQPRDDHAAYVSSWLEILDRDRKAIFTAATQAQRAVDYLGSTAAGRLDTHP